MRFRVFVCKLPCPDSYVKVAGFLLKRYSTQNSRGHIFRVASAEYRGSYDEDDKFQCRCLSHRIMIPMPKRSKPAGHIYTPPLQIYLKSAYFKACLIFLLFETSQKFS